MRKIFVNIFLALIGVGLVAAMVIQTVERMNTPDVTPTEVIETP